MEAICALYAASRQLSGRGAEGCEDGAEIVGCEGAGMLRLPPVLRLEVGALFAAP
jgi:hypothetical protein